MLNLIPILEASTLPSCVSLPFVFQWTDQVTRQPPFWKFSPDMCGKKVDKTLVNIWANDDPGKLLGEMQMEKKLHRSTVYLVWFLSRKTKSAGESGSVVSPQTASSLLLKSFTSQGSLVSLGVLLPGK